MEVIVAGLFVLAILSGMLGLGVAFAAVPFLSFFMQDLVHQVQPISLLLNGVTALFAVAGFASSGYVVWKKAFTLALVTTLFAPVGSWLVQFVPQNYIWYIYLAAVSFLVYRLFRKAQAATEKENFKLILILAVPISILSGFLGVGPGFLLMPTLILLGFQAKQAAGINAFAVTPPSFSALIPHWQTAQFDLELVMYLVIAGAVGSFIGAKVTSVFLPSDRLKQLFGILIIVMTGYKVYRFISG